MYRFLPGIARPKDTDFLRRYMSFEKFVSLLGTKSLFFTRADKFEDPFEGFMPPSVKSIYESEVDNKVPFQSSNPLNPLIRETF